MIAGRCYVQLAAICHWDLPLCIYITLFFFKLCLAIFYFLFFGCPFVSFNVVSINETEWSTISACPSLMFVF